MRIILAMLVVLAFAGIATVGDTEVWLLEDGGPWWETKPEVCVANMSDPVDSRDGTFTQLCIGGFQYLAYYRSRDAIVQMRGAWGFPIKCECYRRERRISP